MTMERKTAAIEFMKSNPEFMDDILTQWQTSDWMDLDDAAERVWRKVKFFGKDYKEKNIQHRILVGDADYKGQGSISILWDADNFSFTGNPFESFLILRNPDIKG